MSVHANAEFRKKIISLLLDAYYVIKFSGIILPEYFETDEEKAVVKALLQYHAAYRRTPSDPIDVIALAGEECTNFVFDLYDMTSYDKTLASDVVITYAKEQRVKIAVLDSVDDIQKGKLDTIVQRVNEALNIDSKLINPGMDLIDDSGKWLEELWVNKVSTGWSIIDNYLEGGFGAGEYVLFMAPSNRGKTMSLVNIGYGAATIGSGKKVIHWTGELAPSIVLKRYAARMLHHFIRRGENIRKYQKELITKAKKLLPGKVRVIGNGRRTTLLDFENQLDAIRNDGFLFDEILVDYPDLINSNRRHQDERFEYQYVAEGLRELGNKYGVPVVGASQSNRGSYNKETLDLSDIAEAISKVNTADIVITMSMTREEYSQNRCRLHLEKVRDGKRIVSPIYAKYYTDSQAIITIGE